MGITKPDTSNLEVYVHDLILKNPVMTASGTFGYGLDFNDFFDVSKLGGIVTKAVSKEPRQGNSYPRMAETTAGMLNAVGLQNKGIDNFEKVIYPELKKIDTTIVINVAGHTVEDYVHVCERLNELSHVHAIELNISCPNVKDGLAFGTSCPSATALTIAVRKVYHKTLIVKLSPNVTSIVDIARAVEDGGADALSLINTLLGMAIDAEKRKPILSTTMGGLSGPAIKPVALRMVYQVSKAVGIPVIGIGGIMTGIDAIEFLLAGATAIQVGTANFIYPDAGLKVLNGIEEYMKRHGVSDVNDLIGALNA
jgi:dihydroorotate dehydrogenase (NAD+) catalytic subunit